MKVVEQQSTRVLIIGAGPTGLTLACELARRNIKVRIIERSPEFQRGSRAKGLQPRSLEIMNDLGLTEELLSAGCTEVRFRRFNGPTLLGDFKPEILIRNDTRYSNGILLPQWKVEEVLRSKLASFGVEVELATELTAFSQNKDRVLATLESPSGKESVSCHYLVGCDGGKSTVRKMLDIKFEGTTHDEERALIGDTEVEGLRPDAWHIWMHPTLGFGFSLCPFKDTPAWQLQTMAVADAEGRIAEPDLETFQRLFTERTGMQGVTLKNVTWATVYRVNIRMAEHFRSGRIFIAGDAAHVHSIAGGLGMNTGIQDAYNLGWKLALVLDKTDESLLDTYEEERFPIAAWTLNISSEKHRAVMDAIKKGGDGGLHTLDTKDTTQLNLHYRYSSLSVNLYNGSQVVQAGDRAPDGRMPDGTWLSDFYRGTHFTILYAVPPADEPLSKIFGADKVRSFVLPGELLSLFGSGPAVWIVRPDGYIGLVAGADNEEAVFAYFSRYLQHEASR